MRFVADHCVPRSTGERLTSEGHEVIGLSTRLPIDAGDATVIEEEQEMGALLLSLNGVLLISFDTPPNSTEGSSRCRFEIDRKRSPRLWTSCSGMWRRIHVESTTAERYCWSSPIAFVSGRAHNAALPLKPRSAAFARPG